MRRALLVAVLALAACDQDDIVPTTVQWMEWPAQVGAADPFKVRLVVTQPCAATGFRARSEVDVSAVTLAPYFLHQDPGILCLAEWSEVVNIAIGSLDTSAFAPGLPADFSRTYEMRATTDVYALVPLAGAIDEPVRTFGEILVSTLPPPPGPLVRNAGGRIFTYVDDQGCLRINPVGLYSPTGGFVLENPLDTARLSGSFVRGYVHTPATPVCGQTEVFHLTGRN